MGRCPDCNQFYYLGYCRSCNSGHFRANFPKWSGGDDNIDRLIQKSQLNAGIYCELLEWIEYSNLIDMVHVAEGGFASVYKAVWKDGPITSRESKRKFYFWNVAEWKRKV